MRSTGKNSLVLMNEGTWGIVGSESRKPGVSAVGLECMNQDLISRKVHRHEVADRNLRI
jgi:hypothetical protein